MNEEARTQVKTVKSQTEGRWQYKAQVVIPSPTDQTQYEWIVTRYPSRSGLVQPPAVGKDMARGLEDSYEEATKNAIKALNQAIERERSEA